MDDDIYKTKIKKLIKKLKEKGLIKTYEEFLETDEAKYYISKHNEESKKYKIGDIVFVF